MAVDQSTVPKRALYSEARLLIGAHSTLVRGKDVQLYALQIQVVEGVAYEQTYSFGPVTASPCGALADPDLQLRARAFPVDRMQLARPDQRVVEDEADAEDLSVVSITNRVEPFLMLFPRRRVEVRAEQYELAIGDPAVEDFGILLAEGRQDDRLATQHDSRL